MFSERVEFFLTQTILLYIKLVVVFFHNMYKVFYVIQCNVLFLSICGAARSLGASTELLIMSDVETTHSTNVIF